MKPNLTDAKPCPNCGEPLPSGALAGLCPACLLAQGSDTAADVAHPRPRFEPPPLPEVAKLFPQLELLGLLGAGGMGAVYRARQPALDRIVALKILPANDAGGVSFAERFNREARALARLNHPNIVGVYEFGQAGDLHFFLMEFVDGANLRQLEKAGRLSPREALQIIPQICDALQYAHDEGVVHRDIKPENVLVDRKGRVKIADFGLAKILGANPDSTRLTAEGQVMGTPHYMAPEQLEHPLAVDHRADIYSLGVVFYEMLTGDLPLGRFSPPSRKVQVDVRLDEVVLRALENDPARRYQQAGEVKTRVETIAGSLTEATGRPSATPAPTSAPVVPSSGPSPTDPRWSWAGFPLAFERDGQRRVDWKVAAKAAAVSLGVLTLVFTGVTTLTGRSVFGWIGVVGWPSLVGRVLLSLAIVAWATRRTLRLPEEAADRARGRGPDDTRILARPESWWSRHWRAFALIPVFIGIWVVFQWDWMMPRIQRWAAVKSLPHIAVRDQASGALTVELPDGVKLELLAITDPSASPQRWWRADGKAVTDTQYQILMSTAPDPNPSELGPLFRAMAFRRFGGSTDPEPVVYDCDPAILPQTHVQVNEYHKMIPRQWSLHSHWPAAASSATLRFGFAVEPWLTALSYHLDSDFKLTDTTVNDSREWFALLPMFQEISPRRVEFKETGEVTLRFGRNSRAYADPDPQGVSIAPGPQARNWRVRVVALDVQGQKQFAEATQGGPEADGCDWTFRFPKVAREDLREVCVEAQLLQWVEFQNVALHPAAPPALQTTATPYVPGPEPSTNLITETPQLRWLAWQPEGAAAESKPVVFRLDGSRVGDPSSEALLAKLGDPTRMDVSGTEAGRRHPRFLNLWIAHPLFEARSWVGITMVDDEGKSLPLAADGSQGTSSRTAEESGTPFGWLLAQFSPGEGDRIPARINLRLRYAVGPLTRTQNVPRDFSGTMSLPNGGALNGVGQTANGRAFLSLAVNGQEAKDVQFVTRAVTEDGREWESSGSQIAGPGPGGLVVAQYDFAFPLSAVKFFRVGSRPIQTALWPNLQLPPLDPVLPEAKTP